MRRPGLARAGAVTAAGVMLISGCTSEAEPAQTPGLEQRGTVLTTVKPERQDLTNQISLAGKVAVNPVFGVVAPTDGEIRYVQRTPATKPATRALWVATIWKQGHPHEVTIPKGSIMAGRLMDDRSAVTEGMPIISARHAGYGIVADIDSNQAYRISGAAKSVTGQIKNGPGPFKCKAKGTIAALPAGTIPEPPAPSVTPTTGASGAPVAPVQPVEPTTGPEAPAGSDATGLQLVCTPPADVKLINGAEVTLDVVTGKAKDVLVLPVEAVAGTQGKGKVDLVDENRNRTTVDVTLGLTDGKVIEIKKGLTGDETVAVPGPNLPTAEAQPGQPG
ncbi:efflux RND transporter periplasmic adaptor subunit [Actinoplanes sp. DH11]|uniref:efflux RND transporter periplasmic adaptor subunit n=1 Tax=Actinoplanes sp. DH11 TaxID=2857011 RepID=UPI001E3D8045|nr:efflux RND transporter periplasmic adaptor subunit [Actinoplanes sp. DH11]